MNYKNILQKCLDELNKEPLKIDKVIGMLETLIEMDNTNTVPSYPYIPPVPMPNYPGFQPSYPVWTIGDNTSVKADEEVTAISEQYINGRPAQLQ